MVKWISQRSSEPSFQVRILVGAQIKCLHFLPAPTESQLLGFRQDSNAAVMYQKSFLPYFFDTDEAGSRVLMSNPHEVWLAQLVTRDRISWWESFKSRFMLVTHVTVLCSRVRRRRIGHYFGISFHTNLFSSKM